MSNKIDPEKNMMTPLMVAASKGDLQSVNELIASGVDVNETDIRRGTALMYASMNKYLDVVNALLDASADPTFKTHKGFSAIDFAHQSESFAVISRLEKAVLSFQKTKNEKPISTNQDFKHSEQEIVMHRSDDVLIDSVKFCPYCGASTQQDANFCTNCGKPISKKSNTEIENFPPNGTQEKPLIHESINSDTPLQNDFQQHPPHKSSISLSKESIKQSKVRRYFLFGIFVFSMPVIATLFQNWSASGGGSNQPSNSIAKSTKSIALLSEFNSFKGQSGWNDLNMFQKQLIENAISTETCILDAEQTAAKLEDLAPCLIQSKISHLQVLGDIASTGEPKGVDELLSSNMPIKKKVALIGLGFVANNQLIIRKDPYSMNAIYADISALNSEQKKSIFNYCSNLLDLCKIVVIGRVESLTPLVSLTVSNSFLPQLVDERRSVSNEISRIRAKFKSAPLNLESLSG